MHVTRRVSSVALAADKLGGLVPIEVKIGLEWQEKRSVSSNLQRIMERIDYAKAKGMLR